MAYNLGIRGKLGFDDMHTAASHKDYETAACQCSIPYGQYKLVMSQANGHTSWLF